MAAANKCCVLIRYYDKIYNTVKVKVRAQGGSVVACRPLSYSVLRYYCSRPQSDAFDFGELDDFDDDERQEEIEKLRDVSRLSVRNKAKTFKHFCSAELQPKPENYTPDFWLRRNRTLWAKYGSVTGVNPAMLWPTKEELQDSIEDEKEWEPSLEEMMAKVRAEKAEEAEYKKNREAKILKSMERMPELLRQHEAKMAKKIEEREKLEAKRKQLMEEARDFFGYDIDPRDEKFKQMQEEKAKREQEEAKKRKKAEKVAKMTARIVSTST